MRITEVLKEHNLQLIMSNNLTMEDRDHRYLAVIVDTHFVKGNQKLQFIAHGRTPIKCLKMLLDFYSNKTAIRTTDSTEIVFPDDLII